MKKKSFNTSMIIITIVTILFAIAVITVTCIITIKMNKDAISAQEDAETENPALKGEYASIETDDDKTVITPLDQDAGLNDTTHLREGITFGKLYNATQTAITEERKWTDAQKEFGEIVVGDTGTLVGKDGTEGITMDDFAASSGRINYEAVCDIGKRVPRIYIRNDENAE